MAIWSWMRWKRTTCEDYPATFRVHLSTRVLPRVEPMPTTDPEPKSMTAADQEPTPVIEPEAAGMSILELNLIVLDSQECVPAHVPIPKAFWTLCFQALSWTFLLWWFYPAFKLLYRCKLGLALLFLCLCRFEPASWLLFSTVSVQLLDSSFSAGSI